MKRINKSLQIPLINEDVALKMTICWITCDFNDYKDIYNNILDRSFVNPFNYLRILGLVFLIASKIINNSRFNIEWLDHIIFESRDKYLNTKNNNKGDVIKFA